MLLKLALLVSFPLFAQYPAYMLSSYNGPNSVTSTGMEIATSIDGIHWTALFSTSEAGLLVPVIMQWNGFMWRAHQVEPSGCAGSGPNYSIENTRLPLTSSSTFSAVATVCINASVGTTYEGDNWFVGDDGIPNLIFSAGGGSSQKIYIVTPTDTTGLTAWNTTATQLTSGGSGNYIDGDLVEVSPTSFVLFAKDATPQNITYWTASSKLGPYTLVNADLFSGPEAPCVVQTGPETYILYMDNPGSNLKYATSSSFPGTWSAATQYMITGCDAAGVGGYCFHPHVIPIQGKNGVQ